MYAAQPYVILGFPPLSSFVVQSMNIIELVLAIQSYHQLSRFSGGRLTVLGNVSTNKDCFKKVYKLSQLNTSLLDCIGVHIVWCSIVFITAFTQSYCFACTMEPSVIQFISISIIAHGSALRVTYDQGKSSGMISKFICWRISKEIARIL